VGRHGEGVADKEAAQPGGRARIKAAATKQKTDAGEFCNISSSCAPARPRARARAR
jgi:hypothetical protein